MLLNKLLFSAPDTGLPAARYTLDLAVLFGIIHCDAKSGFTFQRRSLRFFERSYQAGMKYK